MAKKNQDNDAPEFLYVTSARDDDRVVLHEVDDAHPGGSVLVAGDMVRKVAPTALVLAALRDPLGLTEVRNAKNQKSADEFLDMRAKAFAEAGMAQPTTVAGDMPGTVTELEENAEDNADDAGDLGPVLGGATDPSRAGTGSKSTPEEEANAPGGAAKDKK